MPQPYDEDVFRAFVIARTPALSRTAYLLTGDAHLAEDLVQTALFKAAKSWHRIQGDPEPYVRRILYTQNVSWWRSRRHLREHHLGAYDEPAPHQDADLRLSLEQALARLTTRQRTVLVLRYFEDLTEAQTASDARHRHRARSSRPAARRWRGCARSPPTSPSTWETAHDHSAHPGRRAAADRRPGTGRRRTRRHLAPRPPREEARRWP